MTPDFDPRLFKLPDEVESQLRYAADRLDQNWWFVARVMQAALEQVPPEHRVAVRPFLIAQATIPTRRQEATIREALHTAEVFPLQVVLDEWGEPVEDEAGDVARTGIEDDPAYAVLGWSHFVRAARAGDTENATTVLDTLIEEGIQLGRIPNARRADAIVAHLRMGGKTRAASDTRRVADMPASSAGGSVGSGSSEDDGQRPARAVAEVRNVAGVGLVAALPIDTRFAEGDTVSITRIDAGEE